MPQPGEQAAGRADEQEGNNAVGSDARSGAERGDIGGEQSGDEWGGEGAAGSFSEGGSPASRAFACCVHAASSVLSSAEGAVGQMGDDSFHAASSAVSGGAGDASGDSAGR